MNDITDTLTIKPVYRGRLIPIVLGGATALACLYCIFTKDFSYSGFLFSALGIDLPEVLKFLNFPVKAKALLQFLWLMYLLSSGVAAYVILRIKYTQYAINSLNLEVTEGLFTRTTSIIDTTTIVDRDIKQNFYQQILSVVDMDVLSKDITTPKLFIHGISMKDANDFSDFIKLHASRNFVTFNKQKEMQEATRVKRGQKRTKGLPMKQIIISDQQGDNGSMDDGGES